MNHPEERKAILHAAEQSGALLRDWFKRAQESEDVHTELGITVKNTDYTHAGYEDVFTKADLEAEELILPILKACRDIPIVAEESCPDCADWPAGTQRWLVDPIDGTFCFKNGKPTFSTTIALQTKGDDGQWHTDIGAVAAPMEHRIYLTDHAKSEVIEHGRARPLQHRAIEPVPFSGTMALHLQGKVIENVTYSKTNQALMNTRAALTDRLDRTSKVQSTFSTAYVMARMAEPDGVDGLIMAGNALDYDWDIHAGRSIAEKAGIHSTSFALDGEPVVLLAKSKAVLRALETSVRAEYKVCKITAGQELPARG